MSEAPFDWQQAQQAGLVIQQQVDRVAVYLDACGDLVIRQAAIWGDDQDWIIVIARGNVAAFIARTVELTGQLPAKSGTERSKRYRQRKRDANVTRDVTPHDANVTQGGAPRLRVLPSDG